MPNETPSEKWLFELLRQLLETPVFTLSDLCVHDSSQDVGQVVGLCQVSINSWVKRYGQEGINGLKTKPGRGRKPLLSVVQDE